LSGTAKTDKKSEKDVMLAVNSIGNANKVKVWKGCAGEKEWVEKTRNTGNKRQWRVWGEGAA
jgi:hypothetical protein